jgi:hypothetical protein
MKTAIETAINRRSRFHYQLLVGDCLSPLTLKTAIAFNYILR